MTPGSDDGKYSNESSGHEVERAHLYGVLPHQVLFRKAIHNLKKAELKYTISGLFIGFLVDLLFCLTEVETDGEATGPHGQCLICFI